MLCIPRGLYLYLEGAKTVPDAVENLRKGIALGGLDAFNSASKTYNSKPSVPFMAVKDQRTQVAAEDTLRVVKESIHDSMYESSKTMIKQLDKIDDRLANVVEDFQKKQSSRNSRNRDRDRSNSRDRNNSRDYIETIIGVEIEVETEAEIEETVGTIVETEEDQIQEKVGTTNRDLVLVKDILIERISVTTIIEQVIQHIGVSNLKTI